jgi:hypothetical protein
VRRGTHERAEKLDGTYLLRTDRGAVPRIRRGSTPEPEQRKLYELLGVPLEVVRPHKSWSEPDDDPRV